MFCSNFLFALLLLRLKSGPKLENDWDNNFDRGLVIASYLVEAGARVHKNSELNYFIS